MRDPGVLWVFLPICILMLSIAAWLFFTGRAERIALQRMELKAADALQVQSEAVMNQLEKYRFIPAILARRSAVQAFVVADPGSNAKLGATIRLRELLERTAGLSGAVDIALADASGEVLFSTNGFITTNMITGNELSIAPLQGRLGRASISGAGGRRTYAFSAVVPTARGREAIIIVAAPIEGIERAWALTGAPIFATNDAMEIVAANPLTRELSQAALPALLNPDRRGQVEKEIGHRLFDRPITILDWNLHVLETTEPVRRAKSTAGTIVILSCALVGFVLMALFSRMQQRMRRDRLEKANALRLERKVRERTRELSEANAALEAEISERRQAEAALLNAQKNLIHAEKLAAIGQVSATLAHEYNQPLAAIRTYSENAERYLDRGRGEKVHENLARISALVDRLAHLSRTLLSFASRKEAAVAPVTLRDPIEDAIRLAAPKAKQRHAVIDFASENARVQVMGERIALGQIFLNLIVNGIDAVPSGATPRILISASEEDGRVAVSVADNGTGIADSDMERIFDPFYTTKDVGEGLGLGLSIANETLQKIGGELRAENSGNGAVFKVILVRSSDNEDRPDGNAGNRKNRKGRTAREIA